MIINGTIVAGMFLAFFLNLIVYYLYLKYIIDDVEDKWNIKVLFFTALFISFGSWFSVVSLIIVFIVGIVYSLLFQKDINE
jgi:hypothetical protein